MRNIQNSPCFVFLKVRISPHIKTLREQINDIWAAVDWDKSNREISFEMDASIITVRNWRYRISGKDQGSIAGKKHDVDWESLDWSKNNSMLSRETGVNYQTIGHMRHRLHKPFPTQNLYNTKYTQEQLDAVDWEWTNDVEIGKSLGVSRERIRQLRNELQKPKSKLFNLTKTYADIVIWLRDHRAEVEGKTMSEASEIIPHNGMARGAVYALLRRYTDIEFSPVRKKRDYKFDWHSVNWKLPNVVLKMIYDLPAYRFAGTRNQFFKEHATWHLGGYSKLINDPVFLEELAAEKKKAKDLGILFDENRIEEWLKWKRDYKHPHTVKVATPETQVA